MHKHLTLLFVTLPLLTALACGEGSEPVGSSTVYLSALEDDKLEHSVIIDPGTGVDPKEIERYKPIYTNFEANSEVLLRRPDIDKRLPAIEEAYTMGGRYLDIVAIYKRDVDKHGVAKSPAAGRLTWAMIRLGQEPQAKQLITEQLQTRSQDPLSWFLLGAYWIKYANESEDAAKRVVLGWSKAQQLDPNFVGPEGINAPTLQREVQRFAPKAGFKPGELEALAASLTRRDAAAEPPTPAQPSQPLDLTDTPEGAPTQPEATQPETAPEPTAQPDGERPVEVPTQPEAAPVEAESVEAEKAEAQPVETKPAVAKPAEPKQPAREPLVLLNARARMAMSSGEKMQASGYLAQAIATHAPDGKLDSLPNADAPARQIMETIQLAWQLGQDKNAAARAFRAFAKKSGLDGKLLYEAAMFAWRELEDRPTAVELLERLQKEDPESAKKFGAAALIERARSKN